LPNRSFILITSNEGLSLHMLLFGKTLTMKVNLWPTRSDISVGVSFGSYCLWRASALFPTSFVHFFKEHKLQIASRATCNEWYLVPV
jgi:hypothetical protein